MQKIVYCGAIALLFVIVVACMWYFPIGRDLEADKEFLHKPPIQIPAQEH
ncbi:hypothetical protein [Commensalibacter oyaizuii]|uniref:Uncharacterized protein n=1 Tax=Commensalibacter oyaizuii TaxID=3043873 RepID=A0ABT6Q4D6_9PROT|nr:hypothetical protein [Commensalibacter sp. TBRC 16381]MDI2091833.1 hypothetical protein [Commensalibacter sp. TBRC 16381]